MSSNVTLKEIAQELGLSTMTVSRAINNKGNVEKGTRDKILAKAKSMGYTPNYLAKGLVSKKTFTIGVVIPEISHSFFPEALRGIEEVVYEGGYQLILTHSAEQFEREKKAIEMLKSKRVDGIMISSSQTKNDYSYYESLKNSGIPFIFFDRCIEGLGVSCISVNDKIGSKKITQHLIDHGYKKIAHLSGPINVSIGKKRYEGFEEAMEENGLAINDKWIVESGFQEEGGKLAMEKILSAPRKDWPEAIFAVNDPSAFGAIEALKGHGLSIPEDMAIVGFSDDIRAELLSTPLTTVKQPAYRVGKKAAEKLISIITSDTEHAENIEVLTELRIRNSCGAHK